MHKPAAVYRGVVTVVPPGFGAIVVPFTHVSLARAAVITFGITLPSPSGGPTAVADAVSVVVEDVLAPVIDTNVQIGPVHATINDGGGPNPGSGTNSFGGTSPNNTLPGNCALLVQKHSILGGRSHRGRYYVPWALAEDAVGEVGQIDLSTLSDHQAVQDDFLASLEAADMSMQILHTASGDPDDVIGLTVSPLIATQRRRIRP